MFISIYQICAHKSKKHKSYSVFTEMYYVFELNSFVVSAADGVNLSASHFNR